MKKRILTVFISFIGIFSFTNATSINVTCPTNTDNDTYCTPNPIINSNKTINGLCFNVDTSLIGDLKYHFYNDEYDTNEYHSEPFCYEGDFNKLVISNAGIQCWDCENNELNFSISYDLGNEPIITNGTTTFTPIINRLLEIAGEFVPYFIYIAIGALAVSLLWGAIKWIINYLKGESTSTIDSREGMKSRRRWRRQQRRRTYSFDEVKYNPQDYYPITYPKNIKKARFKKRTIQRWNRKR